MTGDKSTEKDNSRKKPESVNLARSEATSSYEANTESLTANKRKMESFRKQGIQTSGATDKFGTPEIEGLIKPRKPVSANVIDAPKSALDNPVSHGAEELSKLSAALVKDSSHIIGRSFKYAESVAGIEGSEGFRKHTPRPSMTSPDYVTDAAITLGSYALNLVKGLDSIGRTFSPSGLEQQAKFLPDVAAKTGAYLGEKSVTGFDTIGNDWKNACQKGSEYVALVLDKLAARNNEDPAERGKLPGELSAAFLAHEMIQNLKPSRRREALHAKVASEMEEFGRHLESLPIGTGRLEGSERGRLREIMREMRHVLKPAEKDIDDFNLAFARTEILGKRIPPLTAVNGVDSPPGTVKPPIERSFPVRNSGYQSRANDSEVKLLEHLAKGLNASSEGTIHLFTEQKPCAINCAKLIDTDFKKKFPKVRINVSYLYNNYNERLDALDGKRR